MLVCITAIFFFVLSGSMIFANSAALNISISVPISCNFTSTLDSPHVATINPGQYKENIGTTTFSVLCNDNAGYAIYAIGYSNDEYGNTNMLPTNDINPSIATGLAISGNSSNWSVKLISLSGNYSPTIESDTNGSFSDYHIIPGEYTKVATFSSSVGSTIGYTIGSTLQSAYRVYISNTQSADTYTGKVKYTLVHPHDAEPPIDPRYVAYFDEGQVVRGKMSTDYGNLQRSKQLPDGFVATDDNTLSTADSPMPIYYYTGDRGNSYIYTEARKIYLNSDSSWMFSNYCDGTFRIEAGLMSDWDTSKVTNMDHMFEGAFVYSVDIKNFNTENVRSTSFMFASEEGCSIAKILDGDATTFANWNVTNVTDMSYMFMDHDGYSGFMNDEILKGLSGWDVSSVTNMDGMFQETDNLTDLSPIANWDVSNVTNTERMFAGVYGIDATVLNGWDVSKVTNKTDAFSCPYDKRPCWYNGTTCPTNGGN